MKFGRATLGVVVLGGILAGCGGGGGGGLSSSAADYWAQGYCSANAADGTLIYRTTWGDAPDNSSQFIEIYTSTGTVYRTDSINRSGAGSSNITIENLAAGVYEVRARLFSQANAGGAEIGRAQAILDLCSGGSGGVTRTIQTENGVSAESMTVFPPSASISQLQSMRFVPLVETAGGKAGFRPKDGVDWTALGGIGTVSEEGVLTAETAGQGQVRAQLNDTALSSSAGVEVSEFVVEQKKWTVLVYLNAANDLYSFSKLNMNQMEQVAGNPDVRFVVQWKQSKNAFAGSTFDGVRRYLVKQDDTDEIVSELVQNDLRQDSGGSLDMGDPQTLNDFITWGETYYPADRTILILWNHGNGWRRSPEDGLPTRAFSYDDEYGTSIKQWETDEALNGHHLDVIAWDASLMQMMEVAYEMRGYADYIVGSEESPPAEGYPYHLIFDEFRDNPDDSTENLTKAFVDGMLENPLYFLRKITQSSIDTTKLEALRSSISNMGEMLTDNKDTIGAAVQAVRDDSQSYSQSGLRYYRDLYDVCIRLEQQGGVPAEVKDACADVRAKLLDAVVWEGHNGKSPGSHGISIDFSPASVFASARPDYIKLKFAADSLWDEWLGLAP